MTDPEILRHLYAMIAMHKLIGVVDEEHLRSTAFKWADLMLDTSKDEGIVVVIRRKKK